jgi:ParB family chromosome partitioning protein
MHNSTARHAQSSSTQHARVRDHVERDGVDSRWGSTNSTADSGFGNPLDKLIEAGASFVDVLRAVPAKLQRRLQMIINSSPTLMLDAATVQPSRWGGRHESAFRSKDFDALKKSIRHHRGNLQPVLVTELPGGGYELVFGHRRHRACSELGLPVKALVWHGSASDPALIALQDAENRFRTHPSALDQGRMYTALLHAKVYPSQRNLAQAFGISHTWVRKAQSVAALPDEIIDAFDDPAQIQPAHAERIMAALTSPGGGDLLLRAAELEAQHLP